MNPNLLAIETSAHIGAVAIMRAGLVVEREVIFNEPKLSAWLIPAIHTVISRAQLPLAMMDAIAFGAGPGAFTGVRTACASAQALAYASGKALIAVDSLHALAAAARINNPKQPLALDILLDAHMGELYSAGFLCEAGESLPRRRSNTRVHPIMDWVNHHSIDAKTNQLILGSGVALISSAIIGSHAMQAAQTQAAENQWADGVALIAADQFTRGETIAPTAAEPFYVRNKVALTEAERAAQEPLQQ